ncbi:MAG: alpha/beta hydrolase [Planctomycetota bacterium]
MIRGETICRSFESRVLEGNPQGDPWIRDVWIHLPPGYDALESCPVLFVLTGFTGRGRMALNDSPWAPGLDRRADRLLASGRSEACILVFPDCFTRLGGSQYLNSTALGRYEDYVVTELVPWVDREFRTLGDGHRGVLGKSSGGYGALRLAMRNPGTFAALASHSGDVCFELCYEPDFPAVARTLAKEGGIDAFLESFARGEKKRPEQIQALNILAMSAAYSPGLGAAFELPFDLHDVSLRSEVWQRWLAHDPLQMVEEPEYQTALRGMKLVYVDAGTKDQFNLEFGARRLAKRLDALGIRHVYEEFEDDHFSISYRYERSLPLLTRALSERQSGGL